MPGLLVALLLWVGWRQSWQVAGAMLLLFMIPAIVFLLRGQSERHAAYLARLDDDHPHPSGPRTAPGREGGPDRHRHILRGG